MELGLGLARTCDGRLLLRCTRSPIAMAPMAKALAVRVLLARVRPIGVKSGSGIRDYRVCLHGVHHIAGVTLNWAERVVLRE